MSDDSSEPVQEQRSAEIPYATPPRRQTITRRAIAGFVLGVISLAALLAGLCGQTSPPGGAALLLMSIAAAIVAIPVAIIPLRKAAKENRADWQRARFGLILASVPVALLLGLFMLCQGLNRSYSRLYQIKCHANMQNIGQALARYANDHGGQFPAGFAQLIAGDYIAPQFLVCDESNDRPAAGSTTQQTLADFAKPGRCSYIYLGAGQSRSSVFKDFVLAFEPLENHEKEGAHFVFADGRVEWLEGGAARKVIEQLKSGANPPGK